MRILITLAHFGLGGTETYTATVALQLERLGHPVTIYAPLSNSDGREMAAARGLRLIGGRVPDLDGIDVVLAQDSASAYLVADRRPDLPQVFATHGLAPFEHPPVQLRPAPQVIVFNDRTARHLAALASKPELVRLRQPIDIERFIPRPASGRSTRRVVALGNRLDGPRQRILAQVCAELGFELTQLGSPATPTLAPEVALAGADIVVGYGRSVLEGMAMGCAGYVWDYAGGDGWVTAESYSALEADGFAGKATEDIIDGDRLRADFTAYRPELGAICFDLVRLHHSATEHAEALLGLLEEGTAPRPEDSLETLALMVRAEARATASTIGIETELLRVRDDREAERDRAADLQRRLDEVLGSRSWWLTAPLRRAGDLLRRGRQGAFGRRPGPPSI